MSKKTHPLHDLTAAQVKRMGELDAGIRTNWYTGLKELEQIGLVQEVTGLAYPRQYGLTTLGKATLIEARPKCPGHGSDLIDGRCPDCEIEEGGTAMKWNILCEVWGGVTGARSSLLKNYGYVVEFPTLSSAEARAKALTDAANTVEFRGSGSQQPTYRYTAKEVES